MRDVGMFWVFTMIHLCSTRMGGAVRDVETCAGEGWGDPLDLQRGYFRADA